MTAVAPVVVDCGGIWVGWTGLDDFKEESDVIPESPEDDRTPTAGLKSEQAMPVSVQPGGCGGGRGQKRVYRIFCFFAAQ